MSSGNCQPFCLGLSELMLGTSVLFYEEMLQSTCNFRTEHEIYIDNMFLYILKTFSHVSDQMILFMAEKQGQVDGKFDFLSWWRANGSRTPGSLYRNQYD